MAGDYLMCQFESILSNLASIQIGTSVHQLTTAREWYKLWYM